MIEVKLQGGLVNLDSVTVSAVRKGKVKDTSVVRVGTIDITVLEAPASLVGRINADGGKLKAAVSLAVSLEKPAAPQKEEGEKTPEETAAPQKEEKPSAEGETTAEGEADGPYST